MRRIIIIATALLFALSTQSCVKSDAVKFHGVEDIKVSVKSTTKISAILKVENTANRNISISDINFLLIDKNGNEIGQVIVDEHLVLPKKAETNLYVPAHVRISNPILGLTMLGNLKGRAKEMLVSGSANVKMGCVRKKIKVKKMPLSEFISIFEGSNNYIDDVQFI